MKVEISMQQKIDGLNFVTNDKHNLKIKSKKRIKNRRFSSKTNPN